MARSPGPVVVDVTVAGAVRRRHLLTRGGGRPGDELYVTGRLGAAAAGWSMLEAGRARADLDAAAGECVVRYERPAPRLRCGWAVARTRAARACMDLSDGLADAARQMAAAAGLGVIVETSRVPVHPGARDWAAGSGGDALNWALSGGEDYELLFAVAPRSRRKFLAAVGRCRHVNVTLVGHLTAQAGAWLQNPDGRLQPLPEGFSHF